MLALSVAFVGIMVVEEFTPSHATASVRAADWALWAIFAIDFGLRLWLAPRRRSFLASGWNIADLVVVLLPVFVLVGARFFGLARSLRILRLLRFARLQAIVVRTTGHGIATVFRRERSKYIALVAAIIVASCTLGVWHFESQGQGGIHGWFDSVWWSIVTLTTVGYGDASPVTPEGKVIAVVLMITGVVLLAWFTGVLASLFVGRDTANEDALRAQLSEISERLAAIERRLDYSAGGKEGQDESRRVHMGEDSEHRT
jgi:voltage-gated potassium channel